MSTHHHHNPVDDYDRQVQELEQNIAASKGLITELKQKFDHTQDEHEKGRLEVNIEDAQRQLKDWEFELHRLTTGKE